MCPWLRVRSGYNGAGLCARAPARKNNCPRGSYKRRPSSQLALLQRQICRRRSSLYAHARDPAGAAEQTDSRWECSSRLGTGERARKWRQLRPSKLDPSAAKSTPKPKIKSRTRSCGLAGALLAMTNDKARPISGRRAPRARDDDR